MRTSASHEPASIDAQIEAAEIQAMDTLFEQAGLVRRPRGRAGSARRPARMTEAAKSELTRTAPPPRVAANGVHWLPVPGWGKIDWLWHGFSTRVGGCSLAYRVDGGEPDLNLGFTADDDRESVAANRRLLAEAVTGNAATPLATVRQIHSSHVVRARIDYTRRERPFKGDGLLTAEPAMLLAVQTADCIPVLVADRKRRVVAAFHAGWRGTVKRIVEAGVGRMRLEFGSRPGDLVAAIGPGIGVCCYAVGEDLLSAFESQFTYACDLFCEVDDADAVRRKYPMLFLTQRAPGHSPIGPSLHLNLAEANRRQLLAAGVKTQSIQMVGGCASCHPGLFFSHRASQGHAGRMMSVIGIRPD